MKILITVLCVACNLFASQTIYNTLAKYYKFEKDRYYMVDTIYMADYPILNIIHKNAPECKDCQEVFTYDLYCKENKYQQSINYIESETAIMRFDGTTKPMITIQKNSIQARACRELKCGKWPRRR